MGFDFREVIRHRSLNTDAGFRCAAPGFRLELGPVNSFVHHTYDYSGMYEIRLFIDFKDAAVQMVNTLSPMLPDIQWEMQKHAEYIMMENTKKEQELKELAKAEYFSKADVLEVKKFKKVFVNLNKIKD